MNPEDNGSGTTSIGQGSSAAARTNSRLISSFFRDSVRQNRPYQPSSKLTVAKDSGKPIGTAVSTRSTVNNSTENLNPIEGVQEEQETVLEYTSTIS